MTKAKKRTSATATRLRESSAPLSSVLDLWEQWTDRYECCADAVATLIVADPPRVTTFADPSILEACLRAALKENLAAAEPSRPCFWLLAITQFLDWSGRIGEAVELHRDALDYLKRIGAPQYPESRAVAMELHRLLRRLGRNQEAAAVDRELRVEPRPAQSETSSLTDLRDAAFEAFSNGSFADAVAIYRHLLQRNFEMAGTHCHLARVLLALGRDADATAAVDSAWLCRETGEPYIVARILFLIALLATLAGQDAQSHLIMLQEILQRHPEARRQWLIEPVLDRVQPRLSPSSREFFGQLARTISGGNGD